MLSTYFTKSTGGGVTQAVKVDNSPFHTESMHQPWKPLGGSRTAQSCCNLLKAQLPELDEMSHVSLLGFEIKMFAVCYRRELFSEAGDCNTNKQNDFNKERGDGL